MSLTYTYCEETRLYYVHAERNRAFRAFNFGRFKTKDEAVLKILVITNLHKRALKRQQ